MVNRYKCVVGYDGAGFSGYQVQPNKRTVQLEIERVLTTMNKSTVKIVSSGRTDAGVHAVGQVFHFDSTLEMDGHQWCRALNAMLPEDIVVKSTERVSPNFHARYDACQKEYRYKVQQTTMRDPFTRNVVTQVSQSLDTKKMQEAARYLVGEHDFSSFCAANTSVVDKVRTIISIEVQEVYQNQIEFRVVGSGFLYNMVRIIVGTLLEIGTGKRTVEDMNRILEARDRTKSGKTAPPQGLYLWEVRYDE